MNCAFNDFYILIYQVKYNIILLIKRSYIGVRNVIVPLRILKGLNPLKYLWNLEFFRAKINTTVRTKKLLGREPCEYYYLGLYKKIK